MFPVVFFVMSLLRLPSVRAEDQYMIVGGENIVTDKVSESTSHYLKGFIRPLIVSSPQRVSWIMTR